MGFSQTGNWSDHLKETLPYQYKYWLLFRRLLVRCVAQSSHSTRTLNNVEGSWLVSHHLPTSPWFINNKHLCVLEDPTCTSSRDFYLLCHFYFKRVWKLHLNSKTYFRSKIHRARRTRIPCSQDQAKPIMRDPGCLGCWVSSLTACLDQNLTWLWPARSI